MIQTFSCSFCGAMFQDAKHPNRLYCSRRCAGLSIPASKRLRHGHCVDGKSTPEYRIWATMIQRCTNPNDKNFHHYGLRGIMVSERWLHSFGDFIADVDRRPSADFTLDRIDNDKGYQPGNVRWATQRDQNLNKRDTVYVLLNGERIPLRKCVELMGLNHHTVWSRIQRGWGVASALSIIGAIRNGSGGQL